MYFKQDPCPLEAMKEMQFCAAQGRYVTGYTVPISRISLRSNVLLFTVSWYQGDDKMICSEIIRNAAPVMASQPHLPGKSAFYSVIKESVSSSCAAVFNNPIWKGKKLTVYVTEISGFGILKFKGLSHFWLASFEQSFHIILCNKSQAFQSIKRILYFQASDE